MNGGKNMLLFVDTDSIVYANMTDNYRGMSHTADDDIIFYDKHAGHDISWKDSLYRVIRDQDVVLVE